ncbi:MAG: hypothetical protein QXV72_07425 [Sulfolobales archaeon]
MGVLVCGYVVAYLGEKVKPYLVVSLLLILMVIEPHTFTKTM